MILSLPEVELVNGNLEAYQRAIDEMIAVRESSRSLLDFASHHWHAVEPGRPFARGKAIEAIAHHLEAVESGQIRKLLINVPPGFTKSMMTSVFFPAWIWGPRDKPWAKFIAWSYADQLTIRDNRRCRQIVECEEYRRRWGRRVKIVGGKEEQSGFDLAGDQNAKMRFDTDRRGFKLASSVGGAGTGERADFLIIDDPHSVLGAESDTVRERTIQWFAETLPTRVNDQGKSAIIVIMQRIHANDVSGHILAHDLGFEHLLVEMEYEPDHPARIAMKPSTIGYMDWRTTPGELAWPERFSRDAVEDLKKTLRSWGGSYAESGQLRQWPHARGGGMFKRGDFRIVNEVPRGGVARRGWDLAASTDNKAAYTVGVKMRRVDGQIFIEDVRRFRGSPAEVDAAIVQCAQEDGNECVQDIPQDPGQAGKAQRMHLAEKLHGRRFSITPETGSKEDRARPFASQAESGNVALMLAHWNDPFLAEAEAFPAGAFKDQIDACSRAYHGLLREPERAVPGAPILIGGG